MNALRIGVLGPLELTVDGGPAPIKARQQRVVLGCLALRANTVVTSDFLVDALWADRPPSKPIPQLQVYIAHLRRLMGPGKAAEADVSPLRTRPGGYELSVASNELDLLEFFEEVEAGERAAESGDLSGGSEHMRMAVGLFRGPVLPDLDGVDAVRADLDRLDEGRLNAQQNYFDLELALGRHDVIVADLQTAVTREPYRERLWQSYVLCLYRCGRQADALAACRRARRILLNDLGIAPGPSLEALEQHVLRQDPSLLPPTMAGQQHQDRFDNLPAAPTPLVGRQDELKSLTGLLDGGTARLVTITGTGGTGKTRLALAAAEALKSRIPDGVCWVDLAPLTEPGQVPAALASELGIATLDGEDPLKAVSYFLRQRRILLILDNFEHLDAAWGVPQHILTASRHLKLLVTSRRPLELRAEHEFQLNPLALPKLDAPQAVKELREVPSVKFFLDRGRAVRRDYVLDEHNAAVVPLLCRKLDGLPLALELAAARLRSRTEDQLLGELEASIVGLPPALRDLPERQQTLAAAISWSYQLLDDHKAQIFERLGVFAADPTVEAVAAVMDPADGTVQGLEGLARHSLLRLREVASGTSRVSLLQTIREYARDRLAMNGEAPVRRLHAEYYLRLVEETAPLLWGPEQVEALRRLQDDALELRAALSWAAGPGGSIPIALRFVGHLWHYWELTEDVANPCRIACDVVDKASGTPDELLGPALSGAATMCWLTGQNAQATEYHRRSLDAFRRSGNDSGVAWETLCLAVQSAERDDSETAFTMTDEVLTSPNASARSKVAALIVQEVLSYYLGDHAKALPLSRDCVDLARELGDRWLRMITLVNHSDCLVKAGDVNTAESVLFEAIALASELGAQGILPGYLESLAGVYVQQGRFEPAIRILAATETHRIDRGHPLNADEHKRIEQYKSQARAGAGPVRFGLAWSEGQSLSISQALQQVLDSNAGPVDRSPVDDGSRIGPTIETQTAAPWV
ncbi:AfsR/SARP family transcriptional regulator [Pseudarthrobacter niigatensis]|uniref:ATPase/DNA-binding SARP family transcriptional activator n=1 Tax=Pseudarthrobacter niigatensis TaxID=369935 RepID=A0AAJ1SVW4_9MICC|nr:BTAD domain-containing putative transcriptional regulator [Pseudarthrobacter niigatensis]MDQ0144722.1 putative ATPase/DNA-binding SARP family transcriptional activator [Pseudarthrobacter niigatensis]MDQ0265369.1 putative ATPase/DNA-binding SARP family transcriptional activator [Pseudarthrobacter niigatensis]